MRTVLEINDFLKEGNNSVIIDVRTPAEFQQGHIPGAYNIPLFTNEERAEVGTIYKKVGRQQAIQKGIEIFGPRMTWYLEELKKIVGEDVHEGNNKSVCVHCWRGGMRSGSIAWLFETYGYHVFTLKNGYKTFRHFTVKEFEKKRNIVIVGGKTGSGKTLILQELKNLGEQVIDLEKIAHHKGSSFGGINELPQPTQEQFENNLAIELSATNTKQQLFLEDESKLIGIRVIPKSLFFQMKESIVYYCDIPFEERAKYIAEHYGKYPKADLLAATERIYRKLDTRYSKDALKNIEEGNFIESFKVSLRYYDKTYDFGLSKREKNSIIKISFDKINPIEMAQSLVAESKK